MPSEDHHEDAMINVISVVRKGDKQASVGARYIGPYTAFIHLVFSLREMDWASQRNKPQPYSATDRVCAAGGP